MGALQQQSSRSGHERARAVSPQLQRSVGITGSFPRVAGHALYPRPTTPPLPSSSQVSGSTTLIGERGMNTRMDAPTTVMTAPIASATTSDHVASTTIPVAIGDLLSTSKVAPVPVRASSSVNTGAGTTITMSRVHPRLLTSDASRPSPTGDIFTRSCSPELTHLCSAQLTQMEDHAEACRQSPRDHPVQPPNHATGCSVVRVAPPMPALPGAIGSASGARSPSPVSAAGLLTHTKDVEVRPVKTSGSLAFRAGSREHIPLKIQPARLNTL